ncbi:Crp/Fnr family transcriptional regulator [Pigmentibacter ruber]|uniref:Crp/Fnr family transcriptional regulator n=1 Tax=Pigmentibacter ruber TaxID=2683196 RepID=UPI00131DD3E5|nr:cyclic nucleotide-binding domain-containing protein [Pigmentibacter ruber]
MKNASIVLPPKTIVVQEGDETKGIYVIQEGKVELFKTIEGQEIPLGEIARGQIIGLATILSRERHTVTARTIVQTVTLFYPFEAIKLYFNELNPILSVFIKSATERIGLLISQLVEAKLNEKKLIKATGSQHQHASQLAYLLAAFVRQGTIEHDENKIYPLKSFLVNGELILHKKFDYLEKIFNLFSSGGLIKVIFDKKYGNIVLSPNVQLIEDFAVFSINVAKKGLVGFIPVKAHKWVSGLIRIHKRYKENSGSFLKIDFANLINRELGREDGEDIMHQLLSLKLISEKGADRASMRIILNAPMLQKRVIFESISRGVNDIDKVKPDEKKTVA